MASCLWGYNKEEIFPIWIGSGSNGKSLTVTLMEKAFGDLCVTLPISLITTKRSGPSEASPYNAMLIGARLALFQEPENNAILQTGQMKELTGGDTITARPLYKEPITFQPQCTFITCSNTRLQPSGNDQGVWRRLKEVNFPTKCKDNPDPKNMFEVKIDRTIKLRLDTWIEPFLTLLIKYLRIYMDNGLKEPEKVTRFTKEYQQESDVFLEFINDNIKVTNDKNDKLKIGMLFTRFKAWYKEAYADNKVPSRNDLKAYINNNIKLSKNSVWTGIKFTDEDEFESDLLSSSSKEKKILSELDM